MNDATRTTTALLGGPDVPARGRTARPPVSRPAARGSALIALLAAVLLGLAAGYDTDLTAVAFTVVLLGAVLLLRLEWAVLLVVVASVFEDYIAVVTPWASKGVAVVLVGSWLVRRAWRRSHHQERSPVLVVAGVFTVVLLVSAILGNNGWTGADVVSRYLGFLAVLVVLVDTMRSELPRSTVATAYVWACVAASPLAVVSFWTGDDRRAGGPVGDPNDFAFFLVGAVPLAIALRTTSSRPRLYDAAAGVLLVTTVLTLSRGAIVGLLAMLLVGVALRIIPLRAFAAGAVVAGTLVAVVLGAAPGLLGDSLDRKGVVAEQNVAERLDLWDAASAMALDHPVLGMGPGSFSIYHHDYVDRLPVDVRHDLDVAHNTYLELAAELGLVGLAVFLAMLALALHAAWSRRVRDHDAVASGTFLALVGLAASAVFVTEQYFLPLWLMMALAAVAGQPQPRTSSVLGSAG